MANHKQLAADLNLSVYFADPHSPWQRGSNENTNGFIREYLPKAKYIVRTGSMMPWGNVVLQAGIDAKKWFQKEGCITPGYYEERASYDNNK